MQEAETAHSLPSITLLSPEHSYLGRVIVGVQSIHVVHYPRLKASLEGKYDHENGESFILLKRWGTPEAVGVLLHELTHAALQVSGATHFLSEKVEELVCHAVENGLTMALMSNPILQVEILRALSAPEPGTIVAPTEPALRQVLLRNTELWTDAEDAA